jgi:hypothetical protein
MFLGIIHHRTFISNTGLFYIKTQRIFVFPETGNSYIIKKVLTP